MQAVKAYFDEGKFVPFQSVAIPQGSHAIITILDFPIITAPSSSESQLAAFDIFIDAVRASGEEPPEFERVSFERELDL